MCTRGSPIVLRLLKTNRTMGLLNDLYSSIKVKPVFPFACHISSMEPEEVFEINVVIDGTIKCQLFAANTQKNLTLTEVKTNLLDDVAEFIPANYWFLKPVDADSKVPIAPKQEKLIALRKCLLESNGEFSLHLRSYEEKANGPDDGMTSDEKQAQITAKKTLTVPDAMDEQRPGKILKQMTIECAFKGEDRPIDPLNVARGRVHLYSMRDIERVSGGRQDYYKF